MYWGGYGFCVGSLGIWGYCSWSLTYGRGFCGEVAGAVADVFAWSYQTCYSMLSSEYHSGGGAVHATQAILSRTE